ncbi:alpha-L-rhamnosidase C-terminal domain-containing protein [Sphingobacterium sp. FBM7-1]|uniref:alpha-L-rhamnosidase-related protein n=1 Tax=Sphingobacterium sp. FBM7-1 TaxID=2886688 RepID=UPI001D12ED87|nr:alpha-L-rhamnosidase C-terminal domain-containing protein [Sphingobacterium sp. FBM7-1]MCC2599918.1 alpha-L-rhamnosidase [Sphingobacterium sp. FBM7-1]
MIKINIVAFIVLQWIGLHAHASGKQSHWQQGDSTDKIAHRYISPTRILWKTGKIRNENQLLQEGNGQADLTNASMTILKNERKHTSSILLDFGKELHGGLEIVTGMWNPGNVPRRIRVRFGESASEAMAELGEKGATNDHAIRDMEILVPWLGKIQVGQTGFRFVRIDLLDANAELHLKEVRAIFAYRDIPYLGSFNSSDERLNQIWQTGAYTVHLNMQEYLWDGIKRDRLVWVGDLHPEVATVNAVFGHNEVVPKSLDLARDVTPLPGWMSGISTYSMWWIILHHDWYRHHGDLNYLREQQPYLAGLVRQIAAKIDKKGKENMDGNRFLDWPSSEDPVAIHAGLQAMTQWSLSIAVELTEILGDRQTKAIAVDALSRMKGYIPAPGSTKQAAALMAMTDMLPAVQADKEVLSVGGPANFSTFYGYYMLQAMAKAGNYKGAMDIIKTYWGAMLDLGATTFWEDFNINWIHNAGRIDELIPTGKIDVHADYGDYCYVGYRHSLCHGWASGPTAWLTEHVLGIKVIEPGSKSILVKPNLGDLDFAEGSYPTPYGILYVKHTKGKDGKIKSIINAPKEVKIIRE